MFSRKVYIIGVAKKEHLCEFFVNCFWVIWFIEKICRREKEISVCVQYIIPNHSYINRVNAFQKNYAFKREYILQPKGLIIFVPITINKLSLFLLRLR